MIETNRVPRLSPIVSRDKQYILQYMDGWMGLKDKSGVILYHTYCSQVPGKYQSRFISLLNNFQPPYPVGGTQPEAPSFLLSMLILSISIHSCRLSSLHV